MANEEGFFMAHKGEHKYRLATAHMALLCENGQGKKLACAAEQAFLPAVRVFAL